MELRDEDHELLGGFTLSVGVAGFPRHAEDADELASCAAEALAQARALGGDRLQVYGAPPDAFPGDEPDDERPAEEPDADPLSAIILPPDWDDHLDDADDPGGRGELLELQSRRSRSTRS